MLIIDHIKNTIKKLADLGKPVSLVALLKMDEFIDKWTLVIHGSWITDETRNADFNQIADLLLDDLTPEEANSIVRVGLLPKEDHLVEELSIKISGTRIVDQKVNGNFVHDGYVIKSDAVEDFVWVPTQ